MLPIELSFISDFNSLKEHLQYKNENVLLLFYLFIISSKLDLFSPGGLFLFLTKEMRFDLLRRKESLKDCFLTNKRSL